MKLNGLKEIIKGIIQLGLDKLSELRKFYLELATGAGKTYIVFKMFNEINPDVFCLSPRLKINKQNIGNNYLNYWVKVMKRMIYLVMET